MPSLFAVDTSIEASALLVAKWRSMSSVDRAELVEAMCIEADELARLGIAYREGNVTVERERYLMAERRYGREFAKTYFGENSPVPLPLPLPLPTPSAALDTGAPDPAWGSEQNTNIAGDEVGPAASNTVTNAHQTRHTE